MITIRAIPECAFIRAPFNFAGLALLLYFSQTFSPPATPSDPGEAAARSYNNAYAGVWAVVFAFLGEKIAICQQAIMICELHTCAAAPRW